MLAPSLWVGTITLTTWTSSGGSAGAATQSLHRQRPRHRSVRRRCSPRERVDRGVLQDCLQCSCARGSGVPNYPRGRVNVHETPVEPVGSVRTLRSPSEPDEVAIFGRMHTARTPGMHRAIAASAAITAFGVVGPWSTAIAAAADGGGGGTPWWPGVVTGIGAAAALAFALWPAWRRSRQEPAGDPTGEPKPEASGRAPDGSAGGRGRHGPDGTGDVGRSAHARDREPRPSSSTSRPRRASTRRR